MKLRSRMTGTAMVLAISVVGLAACGSDDDKGDDTSSDKNTSTTDDAKADGKPSKEEVVDGYSKLVTSMMGGQELPDGIVDKVVTCFVDEIYDDASPGTLEAIAGGDQTGVDPDDMSLFTDASTKCQQAAMQ